MSRFIVWRYTSSDGTEKYTVHASSSIRETIAAGSRSVAAGNGTSDAPVKRLE